MIPLLLMLLEEMLLERDGAPGGGGFAGQGPAQGAFFGAGGGFNTPQGLTLSRLLAGGGDVGDPGGFGPEVPLPPPSLQAQLLGRSLRGPRTRRRTAPRGFGTRGGPGRA